MIEPEMAFADLQDDMELAEDMIKFIIRYVLEHCPDELEFFNSFVDKGLLERLQRTCSTSDFARVTYTEAVKLSRRAARTSSSIPVYWGCDLQTEHERYLTEQVFQQARCLSPTIPRRSRRSICASTTTARRWRRWTCWCPASARSSAAASVRSAWTCWSGRMKELGLNRDGLLVVSGSAQIRRRQARRLRPGL